MFKLFNIKENDNIVIPDWTTTQGLIIFLKILEESGF